VQIVLLYRFLAEILSNECVAKEHYKLAFKAPQLAREARAGQFITIRYVSESFDPFLRRPFSIYRVDGDRVEILYKVVGRGTALMSRMRAGEMIDVLGPLGNGFWLKDDVDVVILVGEGVGVATVMHLAQDLYEKRKDIERVAFVGAKSPDLLLGTQDFKRFGVEVEALAGKDDWSYQPVLVESLDRRIEGYRRNGKVVAIYACGSNHLLSDISNIAARYGVPCQVSLYTTMACGIGACLCCVRKFRDATGGIVYKRVCKDGPVFEAKEVVWF
jgi:dihydroorotate dehydrogenase electron transfer subunit